MSRCRLHVLARIGELFPDRYDHGGVYRYGHFGKYGDVQLLGDGIRPVRAGR